MKVCTQCHQAKPPEAFSPNTTGKDGLHTWCKTCKAESARLWHSLNRQRRKEYDRADFLANPERHREQARHWHAVNRDKSREQKRLWKMMQHGISEDRSRQMYAAQDGKCAICRRQTERINLRIDHDHESNAVRGLLCHHCNVGIGHFFDRPDRLRAAAEYLERTTVRRSA